MSVPRILLVSNVSPAGRQVGSLFLQPLCAALPPGSLLAVVVGPHQQPEPPDPGAGWELVYLGVPTNVIRPRHRSIRARLERWLAWRRICVTTVPAIVETCAAAAKRHSADLVWAILHEPALTLAAAKVASTVALPLVTTVWDPPEYVLWRNGSDRLTAARVMGAFGEAVTRSLRVGVMSEAMGEDYLTRYGARPLVMRLGIPRDHCYTPRLTPHRPGEAMICFAGSLYAEPEWCALLRALEYCKYHVAGRDLRLRVVGGSAVFRSSVPARAEFLGRRSADETTRLMAEADIAYVPYWFDPAYAIAARQSFPTKISTAMGAGTPILFHGPTGSSVTDFMRTYAIGVACSSLAPDAIVGAIERLLDPGRYAACADAIAAAMDREFTMTVFLERFAQLIGVDPHELRQPSLSSGTPHGTRSSA